MDKILLKEIDSANIPRLFRNTDGNMRHKFTAVVKNTDIVKLATAGAAIIAVVSCMVVLNMHHNKQLSEWSIKHTHAGNAWNQKFEKLENRVKRYAAMLSQYTEARSLEKRSVGDEVTGRPDEAQHISEPAGGVVYVRWGRMDCPEIGPSQLVFHGVTAGSHQSHTGGGANHLCLHANFTYEAGHYVDGWNGASYIYGAEWRDAAWVSQLFDLQDTMSQSIQYHSVPCAVCMARKRHGQVMIPGRHECPENWIYEYDGYIMAQGHSEKHASEYICVDKRPQLVPGTQGSQDGVRLWMVETSCASLHCEPVVDGREIRCVVCTI